MKVIEHIFGAGFPVVAGGLESLVNVPVAQDLLFHVGKALGAPGHVHARVYIADFGHGMVSFKESVGIQGRLHAVPPWLGRMGPASFEGDVSLTRLVLIPCCLRL